MKSKQALKFFRHYTVGAMATTLAFGIGSIAEAATLADISFIIDTSGSMAGDITEVRSRIVEFEQALVNNDIDAQYSLTLFGSGENFVQNLVNFSTFNDPNGVFQTFTTGGGIERGSAATQVAFDNSSFRTDSVRNFILITDEDDDSIDDQFNSIRATLAGNDTALFNFIGRPGVGNTDERYGVLASENGGASFDILDFRSNPEPFFTGFINTKVQEIIDNDPTPEEPDPTPDDPEPPVVIEPNPNPNIPTTTPEPMSLISLIVFGGLGLISTHKK